MLNRKQRSWVELDGGRHVQRLRVDRIYAVPAATTLHDLRA